MSKLCMSGGLPINMDNEKVEFACLDCGRIYLAGDTTICESKGLLKKRIRKELREIEAKGVKDGKM